MGIAAITPVQAMAKTDDLIDVEAEITVAKINCILKREYQDGGAVNIPTQAVMTGRRTRTMDNQKIAREVIKRFTNAGWIVLAENSFGEAVYRFSRAI